MNNCQAKRHIRISTGGLIYLNNKTVVSSNPGDDYETSMDSQYITQGSDYLVAGLWGNLVTDGENSTITYGVAGTAPNRVFVIFYDHAGEWGYSTFGNYVFQIKLLENGTYATGSDVPDPDGTVVINRFVESTSNSYDSFLFLNFSYTPEDVVSLDENLLSIAKYSGWWITDTSSFAPTYGVDASDKYVYANITDFGSIFGILWAPAPPPPPPPPPSPPRSSPPSSGPSSTGTPPPTPHVTPPAPGCTSDAQCLMTQFCNLTVHVCQPVKGLCGFADNHTWYKYQCCVDADCPPSNICVVHTCELLDLTGDKEGLVGGQGTLRATLDGKPFANATLEVTLPDGVSFQTVTNADGESVLPFSFEGNYTVRLVRAGVFVKTHLIAVALPPPVTPIQRPVVVEQPVNYCWVLPVIIAMILAYLLYRKWRAVKGKKKQPAQKSGAGETQPPAK